MIDGFCRQEAIALTGITSNFLSYLEKCKLIVPTRIGNNARPTVLFSWQQVLILAMIKEMRENASLQSLRAIVEFLNEQDLAAHIEEMPVAIDGKVAWIGPKGEGMRELIPSTPFHCTLMICPTLSYAIQSINLAARVSKGVDYDSFRQRFNPALLIA